MEHHVERIDSSIARIVSACFPGYNGKKIVLSTAVPTDLRSYWDGGSRSQYVFFSLIDGKTAMVESNHPVFEAGKPYHLDKLPERLLLVRHSIFVGKDMGITIYANASDLAPMLPKNDHELTTDELIVLTFTKSYKSNYRFDEAVRTHGITTDRWNAAKSLLIGKGLLAKNGAITPSGRNALQGKEVRKY